MPKIYTLGTKAVIASGYKKGKEERRRYDELLEEEKKSNKASRGASAYSASMSAYNAYRASKDKREAEKKALKESDSDNDGLGEYTSKQISDSSVGSLSNIKKKNTDEYFKADSEATKQAYEHPTDEQNSDAYKNTLFSRKVKYKFDSSKWRSK